MSTYDDHRKWEAIPASAYNFNHNAKKHPIDGYFWLGSTGYARCEIEGGDKVDRSLRFDDWRTKCTIEEEPAQEEGCVYVNILHMEPYAVIVPWKMKINTLACVAKVSLVIMSRVRA